jgi:hypothetical protein
VETNQRHSSASTCPKKIIWTRKEENIKESQKRIGKGIKKEASQTP